LTGIGMTNLCFSDEKTCGTEIGPGAGTPRVGTPGSGTKTSLETTTSRVPRSTTDDSFEKTLPIALGIGIPIFVIFWAIVLANDHQNRKAAEAAAITTAGTTNEISGLAMPVNDDREQQTHPTVHPLRV
ncbi:hypothetical protein MKW94_006153, partial [Papaver nudicaule]|nr:hypothetical protein [Papaver nudicaule]